MAIDLDQLGPDWPIISALLDQALALPEETRGAWLDNLAMPGVQYRPTLELLLAEVASVESRDFLGTLPRFDATSTYGVDALARGETIGPYTLIEQLGRGGMGAVWLAERTDHKPRRKVALKLPHMSWQPEFAQRLERERDLLATLEHPNIARLYDAGVDQHARPWFALEYVEGKTLDRYVEAQPIDIRAGIALLMQAASAVAHAHTRLIVHRDLKPANILVNANGEVRLLDFGIARLLDADGNSALTREAGGALTPDYASPEQIRGEPIGTTSDIYSLGIIAFELLSGAKPTRLPSVMAAAHARTEIGPPSKACSDVEDQLALEGDLDAIVMRATRQDPAERYATVDAFAADLQRYLNDEPVLARPDQWTYRARKFVRRHHWPVAAATTALLAIVAGAGVAMWQAHEASLEAARADEVKRFVLSVLESADSDQGAGSATTAAQLLSAARERVQIELADRPAVSSELMTTIAYGLLGQGKVSEALTLIRTAYALSAQANGPEHPLTLAASVVLGEALQTSGDSDGAAKVLEPAVTLARKLGDRFELSRALSMLSNAQIDQGKMEAARANSRAAVEALGERTPVSRRDWLALAEAESGMTNMLIAANDADAIDAARKSIAAAEQVHSPAVPMNIAQGRLMLGGALVQQGKSDEGLPILQRGYDEMRALLPFGSLKVAIAANNVGNARMSAGDTAGAVQAYQESLNSVLASDTPGDPSQLAFARQLLGGALMVMQQTDQALAVFEEGERNVKDAHMENSTTGIRISIGRAQALRRLGRLDAADAVYESMKGLTPSPEDAAYRDLRLAQLRSAQGRKDEAVELMKSATVVLARNPNKVVQAQTFGQLGQMLLSVGRGSEAVDPLKRALALFAEVQPPDTPEQVQTRAWLAKAEAAAPATTSTP